MFFVGGSMALLIRLQLFQPGAQYFDPNFYNVLVTVHGFIMIFGVIMPAFVGLGKLDGAYDDWRAGYGFTAVK